MGKASDWLREERRKTLGDWVAFCLSCGHAQRYFEEDAAELSVSCPTCSGEMRAQCPACGARFSSVFAIQCEACGAALREAEAFGGPIRRATAGVGDSGATPAKEASERAGDST